MTASATSFRLSVLLHVCNERHGVEAHLRRMLALEHDSVSGLELVVVDDGSTDGTGAVLRRLAAEDGRISLCVHDEPRGKRDAMRSGISRATGDIIVIDDTGLDADPTEIPALLAPFVEVGADAVFGAPRRAAAINRGLTVLINWFTGLAFTDVTTGGKAVNATLLKSLPLRSRGVGLELELALKLAKRRARIVQAPPRDRPRASDAGRTIGARDGLLALLTLIRFSVVDDLYRDDEYGSHILTVLDRARRFNLWMGETLRPYVGDRVLEIGAGIGNLTNQFVPRALYVASDINPNYLRYLRAYAFGKPYLRVMEIDAGDPAHFLDLSAFDTVLMLNVLEHVPDEQKALRNVWSALESGGRAIILVPQHPALYGTLDAALEHRERYTEARLRRALADAGFRVETVFDFNRFSAPGWWLNGKILRRQRLSRVQLKLMETMMPVLKRIDRLWPWKGISLIGIGVKEP